MATKKELDRDSLEWALEHSGDLKKYTPSQKTALVQLTRLFDNETDDFDYQLFLNIMPDDLYALLLKQYPKKYSYADIERFYSDDGIKNKKSRSLSIKRTQGTDRLRTEAILSADPEDAAKIAKLFDKDSDSYGFQITVNGGTDYLNSPSPIFECPNCHHQYELSVLENKANG